MGIKGSVWTCDACGCEGLSSSEYLPNGWRSIMVEITPNYNAVNLVSCAECVETMTGDYTNHKDNNAHRFFTKWFKRKRNANPSI